MDISCSMHGNSKNYGHDINVGDSADDTMEREL